MSFLSLIRMDNRWPCCDSSFSQLLPYHPRISIILIEFSQISQFSRSFTRNSMQRRRGVYGIKLVDELSHNLEHHLGVALGQFVWISNPALDHPWNQKSDNKPCCLPCFFNAFLETFCLYQDGLSLDSRSLNGGRGRRRVTTLIVRGLTFLTQRARVRGGPQTASEI